MSILTIVILILAGLSFLISIGYFIKALSIKRTSTENAFNVQRQENRHRMLVALFRGFIFLILSLIFLGVFGLSPADEKRGNFAAPTLSVKTPTLLPTPTLTLLATSLPTAETPEIEEITTSPTSPLLVATAEPTMTPLPEDGVISSTARVNSPNGLWLREAPGGTQQLELIPDGTILVLLPGNEIASDLEWQEVQTPAGNEGWVALDFIVIE